MANIDLKGEFLGGQPLKILTDLMGGNRRLALGTVVEFWELAQHYWSDGEKLIPHKIFSIRGFPKELYEPEINLAEYREEGIYARGSAERFDWLLQRRIAGKIGGQKSGETRRKKSASSNFNNLGEANEANPKQNEARASFCSSENEAPVPVPVPSPVPEKKKTNFGDDHERFRTLPELKEVADIFAGRRIPAELQQVWLRTYSPEFIMQKVKALRAWELTAGAKGKKQNWGRFYTGRFAADWDNWLRRQPTRISGGPVHPLAAKIKGEQK